MQQCATRKKQKTSYLHAHANAITKKKQEHVIVIVRMPSQEETEKKEDSTLEEKKTEEKKKEVLKIDPEEEKKKQIKPLDEADIAIFKSWGMGPYAAPIKDREQEIEKLRKAVDVLKGIKESDTGLSQPSTWDLVADKQMMQGEQPLQVARCTKIIGAGTEDAKYMINVRQIAKYVVGLGDRVSPTDIEEGMRVGVDRQNKYQIHIPLPPKIDPSVTMMQVTFDFLRKDTISFLG